MFGSVVKYGFTVSCMCFFLSLNSGIKTLFPPYMLVFSILIFGGGGGGASILERN